MDGLAPSAIDPLAAFLPPTLLAACAIAFALLWRRAVAKSDKETAERLAKLETQVASMALADAKVDYVSRDQHNNLAQSIRDAIKATDLDVRELKTRLGMLERDRG
jgi:hypothetical protein